MGAGFGDSRGQLSVGDTYLCSTGRDHNLWVVVAVDGETDQLISFPVGPRYDGCDEGCIIQPAEHPRIVSESVVKYIHGRSLPTDLLRRSARWYKHEPASPDLLRRIRKGGIDSRFTRTRYKNILRQIERDSEDSS